MPLPIPRELPVIKAVFAMSDSFSAAALPAQLCSLWARQWELSAAMLYIPLPTGVCARRILVGARTHALFMEDSLNMRLNRLLLVSAIAILLPAFATAQARRDNAE